MVVLKYNDEMFTHGIAPISYKWSSDDENILLPHPQFSKDKN
jgi:hypothetical protein